MKKKYIQVRVTDNQKQKIYAFAKLKEWSVSRLILDSIFNFIETDDKRGD